MTLQFSMGRKLSAFYVACAVILIWPRSLKADTILSVIAPPSLSQGGSLIPISTSWSQSESYTDVSIVALLDSFSVGQTPSGFAFLTTRVGPGTTTSDEIARTRFTVPATLPVCSIFPPFGACGAYVTWFSGLTLGPGNYFLTMTTDRSSSNTVVGWHPALPNLFTVIKASGVNEAGAFYSTSPDAYPPASPFTEEISFGGPTLMIFTVTGTSITAIPEPTTAMLIGISAFLVIIRGSQENPRHVQSHRG